MKIRLVVGGLFPADGRVAMTKPIFALHNSAIAPNNKCGMCGNLLRPSWTPWK